MNLASARLGATVVSASDEFFSEKETVLLPDPPVPSDNRVTDRGRWVDGWMTRRRRQEGFEWLTLSLAHSGIVEGCEIDLTHLAGNHPQSISIDACALAMRIPVNRFTVDQFLWTQLVPPMKVEPGVVNRFEIQNQYRYSHLRFNLHPDGAIARLRVWGVVVRERLNAEIDLAALENGAYCDATSDETFGTVNSMLIPARPDSAADGWLTRRAREAEPGYEWAEIQLPGEGLIRMIEIDTSFFRGDYPEHCSIEDCATGAMVLEMTPLRGNFVHRLQPSPTNVPTERLRVRIYPDGGIARLRLYGHLTANGRESHKLMLRNTLPPPDAVAWFQQCVNSEEWARQMTAARPFASFTEMMETGERIAQRHGLEVVTEAMRARLQL